MQDYLLEHENPRVRALTQARLGVKSTILQTRAETYGWMASRGAMPVYLRYAGAGTLRPSGGDGGNWLNLKRGSALRRAICAPDGYLLAPVDSSQIECRVLHYLAGGADDPVIEKFRNDEDPYVDLASQFYGEQIYKPEKDDPRKLEMESKRGMGKQGRLMCGYGASGKMFKATAKNGQYGPSVEISLEDSNDFVQLYRDTNPSICAKGYGYWAQAGRMLSRLADGEPAQWGPLYVADHRIYVGPGRLPMIYDTLEYFTPEPEEAHLYKEFEQSGFWRVRTRYGWKTMWGSKLVQNICEGVARTIVSQAMTRIKRQYGIRTLNWPYDELLLLIPRDGHEDKVLENCLIEMKRTPDWLPGLPLNAEGHCSDRYEK
jgi:DNA polymerase